MGNAGHHAVRPGQKLNLPTVEWCRGYMNCVCLTRRRVEAKLRPVEKRLKNSVQHTTSRIPAKWKTNC
jgi:hypothetical protein